MLNFWLSDQVDYTVLSSDSAKYLFVGCFFSIFHLAFHSVAVGSGFIVKQVTLNLLGGLLLYLPMSVYAFYGGTFYFFGGLYLALRFLILLVSVSIFIRGELSIFYKPSFSVNRIKPFLPSIKRVSLAAILNSCIKSSDRLALSFLAPKEFFVFYEIYNQMLNRTALPLTSYINVYYNSWAQQLSKSNRGNPFFAGQKIKVFTKILAMGRFYSFALNFINCNVFFSS